VVTPGRTQRRLYDALLEKEHDRRTFLKAAAVAAVGGALGAGCGSSGDPAAVDAAAPADAAGPVTQALVGIGRGTGVSGSADMARSSLQRALAHATGGAALVSSGNHVFVKVNLNSGNPFPYTTNPHTLTALIERRCWRRSCCSTSSARCRGRQR